MEHPKRKILRLQGYDYDLPGEYFVTICAYRHRCLFSRIVPKDGVGALHEAPVVALSCVGKAVESVLLSLPQRYAPLAIEDYVIMPNHLHILFVLPSGTERALREAPLPDPEQRSVIAKAVGYLKMNVSKQIHRTDPELMLWQSRYHDHIVRTPEDSLRIREYIRNNPARWTQDRYFSLK